MRTCVPFLILQHSTCFKQVLQRKYNTKERRQQLTTMLLDTGQDEAQQSGMDWNELPFGQLRPLQACSGRIALGSRLPTLGWQPTNQKGNEASVIPSCGTRPACWQSLYYQGPSPSSLRVRACRLRRRCKLCWRDRARSTAECPSNICWHNVVGQQLRAAGYTDCCTTLHRAAGGTVRSTTARLSPFILFWLRWTGSLLDRRSAGMVFPAQVYVELLPASSRAKRSAWAVLWMVWNRQCPEDATDPSQGNRVVRFVLDDGYPAVLPGL